MCGNAAEAEPLAPGAVRGFEHWTRDNLGSVPQTLPDGSFNLLLTSPEAVHFTVSDRSTAACFIMYPLQFITSTSLSQHAVFLLWKENSKSICVCNYNLYQLFHFYFLKDSFSYNG